MTVLILRTDGTEETHDLSEPGLFKALEPLLAANCFDTVNLRDGRVMVVDDNGYETHAEERAPGRFVLVCDKARKPVNARATQLYWAVCHPGTTHQIVGDVAIVPDETAR